MVSVTYLDVLAVSVLVSVVMVGGFVFTLKAWDAIRAWRYNRKQARRREVDKAFANGCNFMMGEYARLHPPVTYRITLDRPRDPYLEAARQEAEDMIADIQEPET